jgi:viroplasmin and RNaseH domain-containing protein
MGKKKFYVVWKGKKTGVFSSWDTVKKLVQGFDGAQYKAFGDKVEAEKAFKKKYSDYKGKSTKKPVLSKAEKATYGVPVSNEKRKVDFFIKIVGEAGLEFISKTIDKINTINQVVTSYKIDTNTLKSKDFLIF